MITYAILLYGIVLIYGVADSKGVGAVKFSVYVLVIATTLFAFIVGPLAALAQASGLL